jgi:hypothetical protein
LEYESATCPFPLKEFPRVLGDWQMVEGTEWRLDPSIANLAGSKDYVLRNYQDSNGVSATVLVLYGLATSVFAHTPEVCYPAKSYKSLETAEREVSLRGTSTPARYQIGIYAKNVAGIPDYSAASHMFLHNGEWTPDVASRWKQFRAHPGMFKILIDRKTYELSTKDDPCESLMIAVAEEINRRLVEKQAAKGDGSAASTAPAAK